MVVELVAMRLLEARVQTWKALQEEPQLLTKIHRNKRAQPLTTSPTEEQPPLKIHKVS